MHHDAASPQTERASESFNIGMRNARLVKDKRLEAHFMRALGSLNFEEGNTALAASVRILHLYTRDDLCGPGESRDACDAAGSAQLLQWRNFTSGTICGES